jgi:hypothetical protein
VVVCRSGSRGRGVVVCVWEWAMNTVTEHYEVIHVYLQCSVAHYCGEQEYDYESAAQEWRTHQAGHYVWWQEGEVE